MSTGYSSFVRSHNSRPTTPVVRWDLCRPAPKPEPPPPGRKPAKPEILQLATRGWDDTDTASARDIVKNIAKDYQISPEQILGVSRCDIVVNARHEAMERVHKRFPNWSVSRIGRFFNRDHSTVLHALEKRGVYKPQKRVPKEPEAVAASLTIILPYPASVNAMRTVARGRIIDSKEYAAWKKAAAWAVRHQRKSTTVAGPYALTIRVGRPDNRQRDLDNLLKSTSDALVTGGAVQSDHLCQAIDIQWDADTVGVRVLIMQTELRG